MICADSFRYSRRTPDWPLRLMDRKIYKLLNVNLKMYCNNQGACSIHNLHLHLTRFRPLTDEFSTVHYFLPVDFQSLSISCYIIRETVLFQSSSICIGRTNL